MDSADARETAVGVRTPMPGVVYPPADRLAGYLRDGLLDRDTLIGAWRRAFAVHADRPALVGLGFSISYGELDRRSDRVALALARLGLRPLDRAAFQMLNSPELIVALLGCLKAGVIPLCTLHSHRRVEMEGLGRHAAIKAHFIDTTDTRFDLAAFSQSLREQATSLAFTIVARGAAPAGTEALEELANSVDAVEARAFVENIVSGLDPFQVAFFQISGGSTGVPKIIPRFQNDYIANLRMVLAATGVGESDCVLAPGPMVHNAGLSCFWGPGLLSGARIVIPERLDDQAALSALFEAHPPTWLYMPKPLLPRLSAVYAAVPDARTAVRALVTSNGADLVEADCGVPALQFFGMTEGVISFTRPHESPARRHGSVGWPVSPGDEVRVLQPGTELETPAGEAGELVLRGPYTLHGYYDAPDQNAVAFTSDGWVRSGDLVRQSVIDGQPAIVFEGRLKDLISRGGEKISCEEVERYLRSHPAVRDVAVVPAPCPTFGERGFAFVLANDVPAAPDIAALGAHLDAQGLAKFKWPEHLAYVTEFPTTGVGKLDKQALKRMAAERVANPSIPEERPMPNLALAGVHHTARPTWKLAETVAFYQDIMGLPLVHAITARGWGREGHPDFLHFFFDSGQGSTIAFFYYLGTERPEYLEPRPDHTYRSTHTAWRVESQEELAAWKTRLEAKGVDVSPFTNHEVIDSIYFHDPNGYNIEITVQKRDFVPIDSQDAALTIQAAIELEAQGRTLVAGADIDSIWRRKAQLVAELA